MKYLKVPMDRVGVLIGQKGQTKKDIEEKCGVKLDIDSKQGEIIINESEEVDPLALMKVESIVKAIGRGFSPENAFMLLKDESDFFSFDLYDYVGKKETQVRRLKSRVIGKEGKTRKVLEELTGSKISIYGHTISIVSDMLKMNILKKAIDMLITGSKQATVYRFVETQMKELRRSEKLGF